MLTRDFADAFAAEWIDAWNSHELPRILSHYAEDFEFSSPFIATVAGESSGILKGREAVSAYWRRALVRRPDLRFELMNVFVGVRSLVIQYRRHDGRCGAEHFEFEPGGKIIRSSAHYVDQAL